MRRPRSSGWALVEALLAAVVICGVAVMLALLLDNIARL